MSVMSVFQSTDWKLGQYLLKTRVWKWYVIWNKQAKSEWIVPLSLMHMNPGCN